jgi:hypothetical protein
VTTALPRRPLTTGLRPDRQVATGLLALGLGGLLLAAMVAAPHIDVTDRGHFVSYTEREVVRVDVFGWFTMLAAPETRADTNLMNTIVLGMLVGVTLVSATLAPRGRLRWFFGIAAAGAFLACIDEAFELTETLVYNADWIGVFGFSPDKVDILDVIPFGLFIWFFRDLLSSSPRALWFWAAGGVFFVFAEVLDLFAKTPMEDAIEVVASVSLLLGLIALSAELLEPRRRAVTT